MGRKNRQTCKNIVFSLYFLSSLGTYVCHIDLWTRFTCLMPRKSSKTRTNGGDLLVWCREKSGRRSSKTRTNVGDLLVQCGGKCGQTCTNGEKNPPNLHKWKGFTCVMPRKKHQNLHKWRRSTCLMPRKNPPKKHQNSHKWRRFACLMGRRNHQTRTNEGDLLENFDRMNQNIDPDENYFNNLFPFINFTEQSKYVTLSEFHSFHNPSSNFWNILSFNIRSFNANSNLFFAQFNPTFLPGVFIFSETWFTEDNIQEILGYNSCHTLRVGSRSGGVFVYIKECYLSS